MRAPRPLLALPLAAALLASVASAAPAPTSARGVEDGTKKATKETLTKRRDALITVRDGLSALVAKPAPKGLSVEEKKAYEQFVADTKTIIDGCDALQKKLTDGLTDPKSDLDKLSEIGETESLRLQMVMDRLSKMMSTLSNILKKISDTAQSITQNLK
jgi:hypothetical protein